MTASSKVTRQHITFTLSFHSYMHMHKDTHIDICSDGSSLPCRVAIFPSATWQWFWPLQWQMCPPHLPALWHKCHSSGQSASSAGPQSRQTGRSGTGQWRTTWGGKGRGGEGKGVEGVEGRDQMSHDKAPLHACALTGSQCTAHCHH